MQDQYVTGGTAWFTLSLVNAGLAQSKGRSGLTWWFISLFLGPLATLLIVAWPRGDVAPAGTGPLPDTMDPRQAVMVVVGIVVVVMLVFGLGLFGAGTQPVTSP